jgi:CubicO group peptidase (beta-lactamase class C family)
VVVSAELVEALAGRYRVPGVQVAVRDGRTTTSVAHGTARAGTGERITEDSLFPLGSVTKVLTAVLAMQLVGDGDVDLDGPLADRLPALAARPRGLLASTTLRRLLSHTSGLPDLPTAEVSRSAPLRRHVLAAVDEAAVCEPGEFSYSNLGYAVVTHLVETVLGQSWWDAACAYVLDPLGVRAVLCGPGDGVVSQHAVHLPSGSVRVVLPELPPVVDAAGTVATNALGLLELAELHRNTGSRVLAAEQVAQMHRPAPGAVPFGLADGWGLGIARFDGPAGTWLGHDGYTGGASCAVRVHPETGTALALTTNATSGRQLGEHLLDDLGVGSHRVPDPGAPLSGAALAAVAETVSGTYRSGARVADVRVGPGGDLYLCHGPGEGLRLAVYPELVFRVAAEEDVHRFIRSPRTGSVDALQFGGARVMSRCR